MDIVAAYEQVGTYRGAAALCGTTHKTVKRVSNASMPRGPRRPPTAVPGHRRGGLRDRGDDAGHRRAHLGQAPAAAGSHRRLHRIGPQRPHGPWPRPRSDGAATTGIAPGCRPPASALVIDWTAEGGWQVFSPAALAPVAIRNRYGDGSERAEEAVRVVNGTSSASLNGHPPGIQWPLS